MSSNRVPDGRASASFPDRGAPSPIGTLEGKLDQLTAKVNELNAFMGSLPQFLAGFQDNFVSVEERLHSIDRSLQDQNRRLECFDRKLDFQNNKLDILNRKFQKEVQKIMCQISNLAVESGTRDKDLATLVDSAVSQGEPRVDEALELLPTARRLGMNNLAKKLMSGLLNALTVANCIVIFQVASVCEVDELFDASYDKICQNFNEVSKTNSVFFNLSLDELSLLIYSDCVRATEEQVFEAIVLWIRADLPKRQSFISQILPAVRVRRCSLRFLKQTLDHFLVQNQDIFRTPAEERIRVLTSGELSQDCFATRDVSRADNRYVVFVMGGSENTTETLNPAVGSWVSHKIQDAIRGGTCIGSWGHKILVLEQRDKTFRSFDDQTMKWSQLQYLPQDLHPRSGFTVSASTDHVYVLGGNEPWGTRCHRYDARNDHWEEMASMEEGRVLAASVCHAGKLYCSGGRSEIQDRLLSSLEVLELQGNRQWFSLFPMWMSRCGHCLVSCDRFLWAIGGWGGGRLSDVERYDVEGRLWTRVRPLNTPRENHSGCVLGGRIYVIGGQTIDNTPIRTVEVYDVEMDQWTSAASLEKKRYSHGSCVLCCLSDEDADKYAVPIQ